MLELEGETEAQVEVTCPRPHRKGKSQGQDQICELLSQYLSHLAILSAPSLHHLQAVASLMGDSGRQNVSERKSMGQ